MNVHHGWPFVVKNTQICFCKYAWYGNEEGEKNYGRRVNQAIAEIPYSSFDTNLIIVKYSFDITQGYLYKMHKIILGLPTMHNNKQLYKKDTIVWIKIV